MQPCNGAQKYAGHVRRPAKQWPERQAGQIDRTGETPSFAGSARFRRACRTGPAHDNKLSRVAGVCDWGAIKRQRQAKHGTGCIAKEFELAPMGFRTGLGDREAKPGPIAASPSGITTKEPHEQVWQLVRGNAMAIVTHGEGHLILQLQFKGYFPARPAVFLSLIHI